jgi:hypothetical protein
MASGSKSLANWINGLSPNQNPQTETIMRHLFLAGFFLWSCGGEAPPEATPSSKAALVDAPACGAGATAIFAETAGNIQSFASLVVDGDVFGVFSASYQFDNAIFFFKMNRRGDVEYMERLRLLGAESFSNPSIIQNGNGFGVAWEDHRDSAESGASEIYFARIDNKGLVYDSEVKISESPGASSRAKNPKLAAMDGNYALVWQDASADTASTCLDKEECSHRIYFASISNVGKLNGPPLAITQSGQDSVEPSLLSTPTGFLLAHSDTAGDTSAECLANRGECSYQTVISSLDKNGKLQQSTTIPDAMSGVLIQEEGEAKAYVAAWAEGLYLGEVTFGETPSVKEISRKLIPIQGVPHFSVAVGRESLWIALSDMPRGKKPEELFANDLWVFRADPSGKLLEEDGFLISGNNSRSERPFIAGIGSSALVIWREARPTLFPVCQDRPQGCIADLAVARVSCGDGFKPLPPSPEFKPMIPDLMNSGGLFGEEKKTPASPSPAPAPVPVTPNPVPVPPMGGAVIDPFKF